MPTTPRLIGSRLFLRPWQETEKTTLSAILTDPVTMSFWPAPFDEAKVDEWWTRAQGHYALGVGRMAVLRCDAHDIIGDAGLVPTVWDGKKWLDLGYIISHPFHRQGYGHEAAELLMRYALEELMADRLLINMPSHHLGSLRIAEKLGFSLLREAPNPNNREILTRWYGWESEKQNEK